MPIPVSFHPDSRPGRQAVLALTAIGLAVATGCYRRGGEEGSAVIKAWIWGEPSEAKLFRQAILEFDESRPDVTVRVEHIGGDAARKTRIALAGGGAGDVLMMHWTNMPQLGEGKSILPLDDFIEQDEIDIEDFYPIGLRAYRCYGHQYAMPIKGCTMVVYYNKTLFERFGVDEPTATWTHEDFLDTAKRLTRDVDGDGRADFIGCMPYDYNSWVWSFGGRFVSEDGRRSMLLDAKTIAGLQFYCDLRNEHRVTPREMMPTGLDATNLFSFESGRIAMSIGGPWWLPRYQQIKPPDPARPGVATQFEWDVAPFPTCPAGRQLRYAGVGLCINKQTRYPRQAWDLVKYMCSRDGGRIMARAGSDLPPRRSVARSDAFLRKDTPWREEVFVAAMDEPIRVFPPYAWWSKANIMISDRVELALMGDVTVREALGRAHEQITALLAETVSNEP